MVQGFGFARCRCSWDRDFDSGCLVIVCGRDNVMIDEEERCLEKDLVVEREREAL